jgi:ABC-type glycerol-3-phosphate transport system substrate-binding protein
MMFQNKWIRKTGVLLLAGVLTLAMTACGSGNDKKQESEPASQAAESVETQTEVTGTQAPVTET